ncbi:hypothetical protein Tco_0327276, partial [Tanacetum coccineum]
LDMNLSEYLSQAITYDMDDLVSKKIGPPKKRYCNDFSVDEMVDWAEMEVETKGVEARTSTTEVVEARTSTTEGVEVSKDASDVVETRRCTVKVDIETEYESDDESDYQSDKSVDYLSPGEDELIELRNRMKANRKAKAKAKDKPDSEMNEPNKENSMPAGNVRGETFEEHDIYMNKLLKSFKTADKDGITEDPFISVGEKYTSVAQFKECLTYYALANGFSLWYERSGEVRVVEKYGQRPPRVSAPEKGKQRKQTKCPCASSDDLPKCPWRCYARSYEKAILDSNPGSTVKLGVTVNPDGKTYFDSPNQGEILTATGRDGNNHIYPVAWAVVNIENKDNWTWFLELLEEDLGCSRGNGLTLMFDQHKVIVLGKGRGAGRYGDASGSIGRGAGGSGGASGSRGRGAGGSRGRGVGGSKRKPVSTAGTQKRQEQTQAEPQQTQHEPEQTQVEDQVEQTEDQAEIDLTQLEQTQEPTQDQVHPQEQPQQAALRMPSARILQRKLGKQGSSQNTALNLD